MKKSKKILAIILIVFIIDFTLTDYSKEYISTISLEGNPVKVAVFLFDFTDDFISQIRNNLEDIQKENPGKVEYTFYDGKSDQAIQTESLNKVLNDGVDLILLDCQHFLIQLLFDHFR